MEGEPVTERRIFLFYQPEKSQGRLKPEPDPQVDGVQKNKLQPAGSDGEQSSLWCQCLANSTKLQISKRLQQRWMVVDGSGGQTRRNLGLFLNGVNFQKLWAIRIIEHEELQNPPVQSNRSSSESFSPGLRKPLIAFQSLPLWGSGEGQLEGMSQGHQIAGVVQDLHRT